MKVKLILLVFCISLLIIGCSNIVEDKESEDNINWTIDVYSSLAGSDTYRVDHFSISDCNQYSNSAQTYIKYNVVDNKSIECVMVNGNGSLVFFDHDSKPVYVASSYTIKVNKGE